MSGKQEGEGREIAGCRGASHASWPVPYGPGQSYMVSGDETPKRSSRHDHAVFWLGLECSFPILSRIKCLTFNV